VTRSYLWILAACHRWLAARAGGRTGAEPIAPAGDEDWPAIERLAHVHGVEPLLCSALTSAYPPDVDAVPVELRARWEKSYYGNRIRNAEALTLLARLDERCRADGVEIVSLKGPSAMAAVYGDIGLRVIADLDVLCRIEDVVTVARAARAIGFAGGEISPHHVALEYGGAGGGLLEVHFTMHDGVTNPAWFARSAWQGRRVVTVEEWTLPVMPIEHQIVFDVAHAAHHDFELDLKHAVDLAGRLTLHRDAINWDILRTLLSETGLSRPFCVMARTLEKLFCLSFGMPADVAPDQRDVDRFERHLVVWSAAIDGSERSSVAAGVRRKSGLVAKTAYVLRRLCPPGAVIQAAFDLPTRGSALAYRPVFAGKALIDVARRSLAGS
jgi:hypothetical protein